MPEIKAPPVQPIKTDIELFAKAYFNLDLTTEHLEHIAIFVGTGELVFVRDQKQQNQIKHQALNIVMEYVRAGLSPTGRARLPKHPLPPRKKIKGSTHEARVLAMIQRDSGAYNYELSRIALNYTKTISNLREDGHDIVAHRQYDKHGKPTNTYLYTVGG